MKLLLAYLPQVVSGDGQITSVADEWRAMLVLGTGSMVLAPTHIIGLVARGTHIYSLVFLLCQDCRPLEGRAYPKESHKVAKWLLSL